MSMLRAPARACVHRAPCATPAARGPSATRSRRRRAPSGADDDARALFGPVNAALACAHSTAAPLPPPHRREYYAASRDRHSVARHGVLSVPPFPPFRSPLPPPRDATAPSHPPRLSAAGCRTQGRAGRSTGGALARPKGRKGIARKNVRFLPPSPCPFPAAALSCDWREVREPFTSTNAGPKYDGGTLLLGLILLPLAS